jgi:hypothetical protein
MGLAQIAVESPDPEAGGRETVIERSEGQWPCFKGGLEAKSGNIDKYHCKDPLLKSNVINS